MNNEEKILQMLESLTGKVEKMAEDVSGLKVDVSGLKEDVSGLKADMSRLRTDVDLLKEDQASMRETLTKVAITQENIVLPRLQALAEGHAALLSSRAPREDTDKRLKVLESDMSTVKSVVRSHSDRLSALEQKAQ